MMVISKESIMSELFDSLNTLNEQYGRSSNIKQGIHHCEQQINQVEALADYQYIGLTKEHGANEALRKRYRSVWLNNQQEYVEAVDAIAELESELIAVKATIASHTQRIHGFGAMAELLAATMKSSAIVGM